MRCSASSVASRLTLMVSVFILLGAAGSHSAGKPDAEKIVAAMKANYNAVSDYKVNVSLSIKGPQVNVKDMAIRVYYKKPDKLHIEAKDGFAMVPQGSFFGNPLDELTRNTTPVYVKSEKKQGRPCDVVKLLPKESNSKAPVMLIWVDTERHVLVETKVQGDAELSSTWRHAKVGGKYYLPSQITIRIGTPGQPDNEYNATMKFSSYVVNKGISDNVFTENKKG